MSEIKPCPFCGSKNVRLIKREEAPEAFVVCENCDITSETNEHAVKLWNTRHGEKAVLDEVEGLIEKHKKVMARNVLGWNWKWLIDDIEQMRDKEER